MLDRDYMEQQRTLVLDQWPTGARVDLDEAVAYHLSLAGSRRMPEQLALAAAAGRTLTQPRSGTPLLDDHVALLRQLQDQGRADLLSTTVDSYTRHNLYREAERGLSESSQRGSALLNGFPVVNHGLQACRTIIASLDRPVQVRHGTPDARLLAEISFAAGFTSFEGGPISYSLPYTKRAPLPEIIGYWQYVDRLAGLYTAAGAVINREPFGALTGTLVPPCLGIVISVIEALLAAEQGVRDITLGYGSCGNIVQDVAAIRVLGACGSEYLSQLGHECVSLSTVLHQWMGAFPAQEQDALAVIALGALTAGISGATKLITKSAQEAHGIPSATSNAEGARLSRGILDLLEDQGCKAGTDVEREVQVITSEVRAILDRTLHLGGGDVSRGVLAALESGVIDVPFAPHRANLGLALPARDDRGMVRFLEPGNIPLPDDVREYHRERIEARMKAQGRDSEHDYEMVLDDVRAVESLRLIGRSTEGGNHVGSASD